MIVTRVPTADTSEEYPVGESYRRTAVLGLMTRDPGTEASLVTVHDRVYHTPSKVDCSKTKRVSIPNDTSSESSRRDVSHADHFGTDTIPTTNTVETSTMGNRPRGV